MNVRRERNIKKNATDAGVMTGFTVITGNLIAQRKSAHTINLMAPMRNQTTNLVAPMRNHTINLMALMALMRNL